MPLGYIGQTCRAPAPSPEIPGQSSCRFADPSVPGAACFFLHRKEFSKQTGGLETLVLLFKDVLVVIDTGMWPLHQLKSTLGVGEGYTVQLTAQSLDTPALGIRSLLQTRELAYHWRVSMYIGVWGCKGT